MLPVVFGRLNQDYQEEATPDIAIAPIPQNLNRRGT